MKLRQNEEAVSPVIGVILMVAITVILAAVIAAFVFGMGPPKQAPVASLRLTSADAATDMLKIEHQGGADIVLKDVKFVVDNGVDRTSITTINTTKMLTGDALNVYVGSASANAQLSLNGGTNLTTPALDPIVNILAGQEVTVTMVDIPSGQQIANIRIRV